MCLKWQTEGLYKMKRIKFRSAGLLCLAFTLLSGCSMLPKENGDEALPTINPPKISQKPEYTVKTDAIETDVHTSGKIMATKEEELFFTLDGKRLKDIYVK